jgi:hypothetical protein
MKRLALATVLLIVAGTASAAIFVSPPPAPDPPRDKPAKIDAIVRPSAPTIIETSRAPVPFMPMPRPPAAALASLTEPSPNLSQLQPTPQRPDNSAKAAIERDANKYVRDQTSIDGRCRGRSMTSVTIEPNGNVHVRC